jgi:hypothetical protein
MPDAERELEGALNAVVTATAVELGMLLWATSFEGGDILIHSHGLGDVVAEGGCDR